MRKLDYKHVALVPRVVSTIKSRSEINTSYIINNIKLDIPIIASPMPDVCDGNMAYYLAKLGGLGIIHRFQTIPSQIAECQHCKDNNYNYGCAIGINDFDRFYQLLDRGCNIFCIDIANGANIHIEPTIKLLQKHNVTTICGNVASKECFRYLSDLGVHCIRVGIAGGSVCETFTETNVYHPMFSLLMEVHEEKIKHNLHTAIIADGGIRQPKDFCTALVYADVVMMGGVLAGCKESPSQTLKVDGKLFKVMRGAASFSVQQEYKDKPKYVEGRETLIPYAGKLEDIIQRYKCGLQSSMSYMDARDLNEFKQRATWIEV